MINIENKVLTTVSTALSAEFTGITVSGEYNEIPKSFPFVTVVQEDNYEYQKSIDDSLIEHHANVMFECNVYCNNAKKKETAIKIASKLDDTMQGMKFTRTFFGQTPNLDRTVYRITMRYTAVVEAGVKSGTTTTYQIYRK